MADMTDPLVDFSTLPAGSTTFLPCGVYLFTVSLSPTKTIS